MESYFKLDRLLDEYAQEANKAHGSGGARFARLKVAYEQQFSNSLVGHGSELSKMLVTFGVWTDEESPRARRPAPLSLL